MPKTITLEVSLDLTEPLQNALTSQYSYVCRVRDRYAEILAQVPDHEALRKSYDAACRQVEALNEIIKQVGRHV